MILIAGFGAKDKPHDSCMVLHFQIYVSKWLLVCKFDIVETIFYSFYLHLCFINHQSFPYHFPLKWFYAEITVYATYFVLLYSINVNKNISYWTKLFYTVSACLNLYVLCWGFVSDEFALSGLLNWHTEKTETNLKVSKKINHITY